MNLSRELLHCTKDSFMHGLAPASVIDGILDYESDLVLSVIRALCGFRTSSCENE